MRLTKDQKDMLRAYDGKIPRAIGWIGWQAEPLVKAKYLRPVFIFGGETFYATTRQRKAALRPKNKRSN